MPLTRTPGPKKASKPEKGPHRGSAESSSTKRRRARPPARRRRESTPDRCRSCKARPKRPCRPTAMARRCRIEKQPRKVQIGIGEAENQRGKGQKNQGNPKWPRFQKLHDYRTACPKNAQGAFLREAPRAGRIVIVQRGVIQRWCRHSYPKLLFGGDARGPLFVSAKSISGQTDLRKRFLYVLLELLYYALSHVFQCSC